MSRKVWLSLKIHRTRNKIAKEELLRLVFLTVKTIILATYQVDKSTELPALAAKPMSALDEPTSALDPELVGEAE